MEAGGLCDERLAHARLADQEHRTCVVQPLQAVELFDLRLADRAAGSKVDVFERWAESELGGFDATAGLSLLPVVGFGCSKASRTSL